MPDLTDGESIEVQGSAKKPYVLNNSGGVYSCTCPAWRHQSLPIEQRSCKHLRKLRGDAAEAERTGNASPPRRVTKAGSDEADKPPVLLAHDWERDRDLTGWWMSEKLDGVRAYWNGERFVSRLGNAYLAPDWFTAGLPTTPLDGELWVGRGEFQQTVSIVRRGDRSEHWKQVKYLVFDAPQHGGVFEERLEYVEHTVRELGHAAHVVHEPCEGLAHLERELARVEAEGGEGLMVRQPRSAYEAGRSVTLLKVKSFFDAEAKVIGYKDGRGRHKGRVGSLLLVTPDGVEFSAGTGLSDKQRDDPPEIGAIVTYRFQELTKAGIPRFPTFVGERVDFAWPIDGAAQTPRRVGPQSAVEGGAAGSAPTKKAAAKPGQQEKTVTKPKAPEAPASTPSGLPGSPRRFEFVSGKSAKFWEIQVDDDAHTVRYGRIGTDGQTKTKSFVDPAAAQAAADKLVAQKVKKGYVEQAAADA